MTERVIYSDLYTNFDKHPISNKLLRKTNVEAVKQAIRNLLLTNRGERLFQPDLGSDIRALLFENVTPQVLVLARQQIQKALQSYEPRAELIDVVVGTTSNEHEVQIQVVFRIINLQEPIELSLVLSRIR